MLCPHFYVLTCTFCCDTHTHTNTHILCVHTLCCVGIGEMYKNGQGVAEDIDEAVTCFKKGADLGTAN